MDFNEFWKDLQSKLKHDKEFKTLTKKKGFKARFDHNKKGDLFVQVTLKSGKPRGQIPFNEFEGVWDSAKKYPPKTRFKNIKHRLESYTKQDDETGTTIHVSYIVTLINYVVKNQSME